MLEAVDVDTGELLFSFVFFCLFFSISRSLAGFSHVPQPTPPPILRRKKLPGWVLNCRILAAMQGHVLLGVTPPDGMAARGAQHTTVRLLDLGLLLPS